MMFPYGVKILVATQPIDMRKGFDSLSAYVQGELRKELFAEQLFVFRDKRKQRIKILYWDRTGFVLWYKRLAKGRFRFPNVHDKIFKINNSELNLLLEGIELTHAQRFSVL